MSTYARWLFGVAAFTNLLVGLAVLLAPGLVAPRLGLASVTGPVLFLYDFAGALIALFGYAYVRIALAPERWRPAIHLFAIGKLLAVACAAAPWVLGQSSPRLAMILAPDIVFALLFLDYLRRTA